jgi:hypothetical protein
LTNNPKIATLMAVIPRLVHCHVNGRRVGCRKLKLSLALSMQRTDTRTPFDEIAQGIMTWSLYGSRWGND